MTGRALLLASAFVAALVALATEKAAAVVEVIDHHLGDVDAGQFP